MAPMLQHLLIVGGETPALLHIVPLLLRAELQAHRVARADEAIELVGVGAFDLIVVRHPTEGATLRELVEAVRARGAPSRKAGVVVMADPAHAGEVTPLVGRGVNRLVTLDAPADRLLDVAADLLTVAPRRVLRAVVRLDVPGPEGPARLLSLTENLSVSGMVVQCGREVPLGSRVSFAISLPGRDESVSGVGEVIRRTNRSREPVEGVALRIVTFQADGQERLRAFLRTIPRPRTGPIPIRPG
jgi:hypothetical protein